MSKIVGKRLQRGAIKYSAPDRPTETEKLIDPTKIKPKLMKPNRVKLGISHGEGRFPPEAIAPNKRKYNDKGQYIRHQDEYESRKESKSYSTIQLVKEMAPSNPFKKGKRRVKY